MLLLMQLTFRGIRREVFDNHALVKNGSCVSVSIWGQLFGSVSSHSKFPTLKTRIPHLISHKFMLTLRVKLGHHSNYEGVNLLLKITCKVFHENIQD